MSDQVAVRVNGEDIQVPAGSSVASAVFIAVRSAFRTSVTGEPRAALCGMGICFECRVTVDGRAHSKSCQMTVRDGMEIQTT